MLVKDIMTRQVVAIGPDMPIRDAAALMAQRDIRHFPIVEGPDRPPDPAAGSERAPAGAPRLIGIVSDRDLRTVGSAHPDARLDVGARDPVRRIMSAPVWTAHPLEPIEETARVMRTHRIGAMPVMAGEELVGIVASADLLDALVRMTGVRQGVTRLEVELPNRPGALAGLLDRIASRNHNVTSLMSNRSEHDVAPEAIQFVLRVDALDSHGLAAHLRTLGYQVLWPRPVEGGAPRELAPLP